MRAREAQVTPQPPKPSAAIPLGDDRRPGRGSPVAIRNSTRRFGDTRQNPLGLSVTTGVKLSRSRRQRGVEPASQPVRRRTRRTTGSQSRGAFGPLDLKGLPVTAGPELLRYGRQRDVGPASQPLRWWGQPADSRDFSIMRAPSTAPRQVWEEYQAVLWHQVPCPEHHAGHNCRGRGPAAPTPGTTAEGTAPGTPSPAGAGATGPGATGADAFGAAATTAGPGYGGALEAAVTPFAMIGDLSPISIGGLATTAATKPSPPRVLPLRPDRGGLARLRRGPERQGLGKPVAKASRPNLLQLQLLQQPRQHDQPPRPFAGYPDEGIYLPFWH